MKPVTVHADEQIRPWPEWLRADAAADYCGLSVGYLRNLASAEAIAVTKPSKAILLFRREDIDTYLLKHRKEAQP